MNWLKRLQPATVTNAQSEPRARAGYGRWLLTGLVLPIVGAVVTFGVMQDASVPEQTQLHLAGADVLPNIQRMASLPHMELRPALQPFGATIDFVVRRNDTLERIFRRLQLDMSDLAAIRGLPNIGDKLDAIKPGDMISIVHWEGALQQFVRRMSDTEVLKVDREASGFKSTVLETPLDVRVHVVHGRIESSLFAAAKAAGVSADTIMRLANDIFGWDIDFALDIQPGDSFTVVYEQRYRDGSYVSDGKILAAEFSNDGEIYQAVRFDSQDGSISDYYTPNGRSMRKQFLRAPVDFTHVSSNFSNARFHPILNRMRAHQGVDYAAPTGTPIKAAGDGRIDSIGVKGGYGNAIVLEHGRGLSTLYGHMSRFAAGMHDGMRVQQGQVIGYVGSTGAATGPHLHYEYRINGVHKNPRTVALPDAQPISTEYAAEFEVKRATLLAQLRDSSSSATTAAR